MAAGWCGTGQIKMGLSGWILGLPPAGFLPPAFGFLLYSPTPVNGLFNTCMHDMHLKYHIQEWGGGLTFPPKWLHLFDTITASEEARGLPIPINT